MATSAQWADVVRLVQGLTDRDDGPPIRGRFAIASEADLATLSACLAAEGDTHLAIESDPAASTLAIGQDVIVSIAPRFGFGLIVRDLDRLFDAQGCRLKEPRHFLLLDGLVSSDDVHAEGTLVSRYRAALALVQALRRPAAFLDTDEQTLVFFSDGKFDVPVNYRASDVAGMSLPDVRALTSILPDGTHEKQCAAIMADAIVGLTSHLPSHERFAHLLAHAAELRKRYEDGYRLFASGFSYEKVRDQVEAARVEYAGKIHKVFSDIQNQLLGIPVATIIVATQMKNAVNFGYEFWVNTAVLVGCWVFAVLMVFLLHNQGHTLDVLGDEIARQRRQLERDFAAVADGFTATFRYLARRARTQRLILWTIDALVVIGLVLSHVIYAKLTPPAWSWLVAQFQ